MGMTEKINGTFLLKQNESIQKENQNIQIEKFLMVIGRSVKLKRKLPKTKIATGHKKQLVFYEYEREGCRPSKKTNWIMHEYRVSDSHVSRFYPLFFFFFF